MFLTMRYDNTGFKTGFFLSVCHSKRFYFFELTRGYLFLLSDLVWQASSLGKPVYDPGDWMAFFDQKCKKTCQEKF